MASREDKKDLIRPLAGLGGEMPPAPDWFKWAIDYPSEERTIEVKGAKIAYSAWGEPGARGLLFIHGGRAHRNWWRPFAPFFAENRRVAALDLSGMGDSDWRERYSLDTLVDEVCAVMSEAGVDKAGRPIVIGHSFGGWVTLATVEREGDRLGGAVVIDSPMGVPDPDEGYHIWRADPDSQSETPPPPPRLKAYDSIEETLARFRFLPNQPAENLYLVDYIARNSLRPAPGEKGGWVWKFDPGKGKNFDIHFQRDLLRAARCPLAFIYGEKSQFSQGDALNHLREQAKGRSPFVMIPDAYHHLMMDQPIAFVSALRTLLSCWPVRAGS